jgi:AcrR family transcriptional regulator
MAPRQPRGSYAKGTAKREEIILSAVEAFGRTGYHATSMREIAAACNLSQAGLLHHFPSKEALLLAIVDYRETQQGYNADEAPQELGVVWPDSYLKQAESNQEQESLTRLWANLLGEASDPDHPGHGYFKTRYRVTRSNFAAAFADLNGRETPNREDQMKAAIFAAIWDGLQQQWLLDEEFDMMPSFDYALEMLARYTRYKE